ncbi:PREDICTED: FIT family protein CG10671 [Acromyrmex echinatior]|uniref:FIT family protein n=1 Tax=Acromyrmex echinatior TaxID=103372 RepID=F4WWY2_ACREC|nr:PREDICTED: FIT family protein CG10671 [Acromyrmex echinatior]EGI61225.1 FIT family protein [Acromyrmex echinatior]
MATGKRRSIHTSSGNPGSSGYSGSPRSSSRMNFRPSNTQQEDRGGTRPTAAPSSIGLILVTMLLHICKKSLLFDTRLKVAIYCGTIFIVSLIADFIAMPRTYFSRSDNALNQYFVKWGWGWLLSIIVPWVVLTAHTLGCGRRRILLRHLARVILATCAWLIWTKLFNYIETNYGRCLGTRDIHVQSKAKCLQSGRFWSGLDISGHTFILIYSSLILAEEGSSLVGWEGIKDLIMREEHTRSVPTETSTGPLRNLSDDDLGFLKKAHRALTPYLRGLFVAMTLQQLLWDIMLVSTMLYYHIMIEKFLGGAAAVITWYVTYQWWYKLPKIGLPAPGDGLFKYNEIKINPEINARVRRSTLNGTKQCKSPQN